MDLQATARIKLQLFNLKLVDGDIVKETTQLLCHWYNSK